MSRKIHQDHRTARRRGPSLQYQNIAEMPEHRQLVADAVVDCGWGNLIMAHSFSDAGKVASVLEDEPEGRRNIAIYVRDPHVILARAPQSLFLDPSHTYRMWFNHYYPGNFHPRGFGVRLLRSRVDAAGINRIYSLRQMVPVAPTFIWRQRTSRLLTYIVAEDHDSGEIIGTATGVDHLKAFEDPEQGASLWCLAVDPQSQHPGVGEALVRYLIEHYQARGRAFLDLSVMHNNRQAIALYEKLGFQRVPVFAIKRKNAINEPLYTGPGPEGKLNPYARIITNEAMRRGVQVQVVDAEEGYFRLSLGGRSILCRESLSELTSAVAMSRCEDKRVTHRVLRNAGLRVPVQTVAGEVAANVDFLERHGAVVVKPAIGEQGHGISVDVRDPDGLQAAINHARQFSERVILEEFCPGEDLRLVVINFELVAAAVRKPPKIMGDGRHSINELIEKQSRRRAAATGGESKIPLDAETRRVVELAGYRMDQILDYGVSLEVRKTANLHTGGTIHDVTRKLHPELRAAGEEAARVLDMPVVGLDFMVAAVDKPDYTIIEANERPGLANHEPQPTAERFLDLLFPLSVRRTPRTEDHAQA